jgi:hypothetical protein
MKILLVLCAASLSSQTPATIAIDTTHSTPLNANFSGFNDEVVFPAEFYDYRLNNLAAQLSPWWVRYPSGSFSDAFDWQTGMMVPAWAAQIPGRRHRFADRTGLDQINISIPATRAGTGDARVYLIADDVSSNVVALRFQ